MRAYFLAILRFDFFAERLFLTFAPIDIAKKQTKRRMHLSVNFAVKIMNFIFIFSVAASIIALSFTSPDGALPAMLAGANKALLLCFTLASVYSVWAYSKF